MTDVERTEVVRAPARRMVLVGGLVLATTMAAFFRVPVLPRIGDELGMTPGRLGLITTVFALGRLVADIPAGRLADRMQPTRSLGGAGVLLALGSGAFGLATSAVWVLAAAAVLGVATAVSSTAGMTYFSTAAPTERRGTAMGAFSAALLGGMALGPMIGGVLADSWGWRVAVLSASVIGLMVAALGVGSHERGLSGGAGGRVGPISAAAVAVSGRRSATVERLVLYAVAFASFFMFGAIPETLVPIIGADEHGLTASRIGFALGLGGACRLLGSVVGGRLADRISRKATLVPGLGLCALGVAILAVDGAGVGGWLTAIVLFSLGSYGIPVGATMLADQSAGTGVGRRLGTYRFVGDLGLIAGPALTALLYEHASVRVSVLVVTGLLTTVAVLSGLLLENAR